MFRMLVIIATVVFATECTDVDAQGRRGSGNRGGSPGAGGAMRGPSSSSMRGPSSSMRGPSSSYMRRPSSSSMRGSYGSRSSSYYRGPGNYRSYPSSSFRFGIGIGLGRYPSFGFSNFGYSNYGYGFGYPYRTYGYSYDPYLYRSPYTYGNSIVVSPVVPTPAYESYEIVDANPYGAVPLAADYVGQMIPASPADLAMQLRSAAQQLSRSLATRQDGDVWTEYLAPQQIIAAIESGDSVSLTELLTHYDGVVGNPQLRSIANMGGFQSTRRLLRQYASQPTESTEPMVNEVAPESVAETEENTKAAETAENTETIEDATESLPVPEPNPIPNKAIPEPKAIPVPVPEPGLDT